MSRIISRRTMIACGVTAVAGAAAVRIAGRYGLIPPDSGGLYGIGETLTYASQRLLIGKHALAREFSRSDISRVIPVNGPPPEIEAYDRLLVGAFADWKLRIDGMVARPAAFSLADLQKYPAHTQITHQACEEGWSFIAEWTGVRLSHVLDLVQVDPRARYLVFFSFVNFWESIDMIDALHPQTFLAYGLNGRDLPPEHGAPVRVRVARQLGYKSVKYLARVIVTDSLEHFGKGVGGINPEYGYSWWAGI
jgi:DMSO/TMAO reductase YedYZ molybdopterin-dependent catalytic subunit